MPKGIVLHANNADPRLTNNLTPSFYHMPHINNHGPPLKLDKSNFTIWKTLMKSHICSASTQLWGIIKIGFYP
jgi:hypothetical protein